MNSKPLSSVLEPLRDDQIIDGDELARLVIEKLQINGTGCVCVVDRTQKLVGIITDGDVRRMVHNSANSTLASLFSHTAEKIANRNVRTGTQDMTVLDCVRIMYDLRIGVLPIVDGERRLVAILKLHRLLGFFLQ